jgi:hypothetical protein
MYLRLHSKLEADELTRLAQPLNEQASAEYPHDAQRGQGPLGDPRVPEAEDEPEEAKGRD